MRPRFRSAFAVVAGLLLVATATFGGVVGPGSSSVGTAEAQSLGTVATTPTIGVALVEKVSSIFTNQPDTDELEGLDAQETKQSIYDEASIQKQNNELVHTAYGNYLNDTETIALMEGKNAYIRALENGSAEPVARSEAIQAVADYYATKQTNIISAWNTTATVAASARRTANETTGVNSSYVTLDTRGNQEYTVHLGQAEMTGETGTLDTTLVNSSSVSATSVRMFEGSDGGYYADLTFFEIDSEMREDDSYTKHLRVEAPNSNFDAIEFGRFPEFQSRWNAIEQQNDDVQSQLDEFVNNTYDSYQQGDINTSDLVDPYLGARDYDPETSDTWTMRSLSSMGIEPPENLSNVGRMNVSAGGTTYTGTLMSDGTPDGGYAVGGTYDAANITGAQFVALDDGGAQELEGEFTLESVETADGETLAENETVEYKEINYQTANTSDFKALQEDLDELTAEINAKQQQARNAGGGGLLPDFGSGGAIPGALILGGAVVLLLNRS